VKKGVFIGSGLILAGVLTLAVFFQFFQPEREAETLLTEGRMTLERGGRDSINTSINIFTRLIAKYPGTKSEILAYYYIAQGYEKLGLNRLAYLKYLYLLKNKKRVSAKLQREVRARLAALQILRNYTEEGTARLLNLLSYNNDRDFRSRVYTELGHAFLKNNELAKSKKMFDIALNENGSNEEAILGKARTLKRMGYSSAAYDLYEYFLKYFGSFSEYTRDVKRSYLKQVYSSGYDSYVKGRYWDAISYFNRIVRIFPDYCLVENAVYMMADCYFELQRYNEAIKYYNLVLGNGFHHKDQDALIKKGYIYYLSGKYDLAAREFQKYLNDYPNGRHVAAAKRWKEMSGKELLGQIQNRIINDIDDEYIKDIEEHVQPDRNGKKQPKTDDKKEAEKPEIKKPDEVNPDELKKNEKKPDDKDKGVMEGIDEDSSSEEVENENVAEL